MLFFIRNCIKFNHKIFKFHFNLISYWVVGSELSGKLCRGNWWNKKTPATPHSTSFKKKTLNGKLIGAAFGLQ